MSDPSVSVRRAGPADLPSLTPLMERFNEEEGIRWRPDAMLPAFERLLADPSLGVALLARDDAGTPLGYALATFGFDIEWAGPDAFLTELFVAPSGRGRGVGRTLLDAIVAALAARDVRAVHLVVRHENAPARTLYSRSGFREIPRLLMTRTLEAPATSSAQPRSDLRFVPYAGEREEVIRLIAENEWPFHGTPRPTLDEARRIVDDAPFEGPAVRTTWILDAAGERIGFVRAFDLDDPSAVFDLRVVERARRQGVGCAALRWLVERIFAECDGVLRIEAHVRSDNLPMRGALERCGWTLEAFRRDAWPSRDGSIHDALGYAMLRRDMNPR